jgi:hypothetical protein
MDATGESVVGIFEDLENVRAKERLSSPQGKARDLHMGQVINDAADFLKAHFPLWVCVTEAAVPAVKQAAGDKIEADFG